MSNLLNGSKRLLLRLVRSGNVVVVSEPPSEVEKFISSIHFPVKPMCNAILAHAKNENSILRLESEILKTSSEIKSIKEKIEGFSKGEQTEKVRRDVAQLKGLLRFAEEKLSGLEKSLRPLKKDWNTITDLLATDIKLGVLGSRFYSKSISTEVNLSEQGVVNFQGCTIFQFACQYGTRNLVKLFIDAAKKHPGFVKIMLMQAKPDNWTSKCLNEILMDNVRKGEIKDLKFHVGLAGYVNASSVKEEARGDSLLHLAVRYKRADIVEYLLRTSKLFISKVNKKSRTVIHLAAKCNYVNIFQLLVSHANTVLLNDPDKRGMSALELAVSKQRTELQETIKRARICIIAAKAGADCVGALHLMTRQGGQNELLTALRAIQTENSDRLSNSTGGTLSAAQRIQTLFDNLEGNVEVNENNEEEERHVENAQGGNEFNVPALIQNTGVFTQPNNNDTTEEQENLDQVPEPRL